MITYAQNQEDVILARVFAGKTNGFYIDVSASHPEEGSVTKHFYDIGWTGLNVKPNPQAFELISPARPRDINVCAAIGQEDREVLLYLGDTLGETSALPREGVLSFRAPGVSLRSLCERFVTVEIDFLKVEVGGYEYDVLRGGDWERFRPRIVVCEVTYPWSNRIRPEAAAIDSLLAKAAYQLAYFDGLNRYYVAREAAQLAPSVALQPNVIDNYVTKREATLIKKIDGITKKVAELNLSLQASREQVRELAGSVADREQEALAQIEALRSELSVAYRSLSWRITVPLRVAPALVEGIAQSTRRVLAEIGRRAANGVRVIAPGAYRRISRIDWLRRLYVRVVKHPSNPGSLRLSESSAKRFGSSRTASTATIDPARLPMSCPPEGTTLETLLSRTFAWRLGERVD